MPVQQAGQPTAVVSQILDLTAGTGAISRGGGAFSLSSAGCMLKHIVWLLPADGGINMSEQQRGQVDSLLEQLESVGHQQQPRPLDNPLLYGNYNVAYTSTSRAQGERGQREGDSCQAWENHSPSTKAAGPHKPEPPAQQQSRAVGQGMEHI